VRGLGADRHVEVKGSALDSAAVELTVNEVTHAHNYPCTDLVVVDQIAWAPKGGDRYQTRGGRLRVWENWAPEGGALAPTRYRYQLPDHF
jgi:hypothetical protein